MENTDEFKDLLDLLWNQLLLRCNLKFWFGRIVFLIFCGRTSHSASSLKLSLYFQSTIDLWALDEMSKNIYFWIPVLVLIQARENLNSGLILSDACFRKRGKRLFWPNRFPVLLNLNKTIDNSNTKTSCVTCDRVCGSNCCFNDFVFLSYKYFLKLSLRIQPSE